MMNQRRKETTAELSGLVYVYNQSIDSLYFFLWSSAIYPFGKRTYPASFF